MAILLTFAAVWYVSIFRSLLNGTMDGWNTAVFLLGGALLLYIAYRQGRTALTCRKKRREAISGGKCRPGIIRRVESERVPYRGRHGHIYYRRRYYLIIEKMEDGFDFGVEIRTGAYRVPVHLYLKSREVKLYSDPSGWNWYVEGLQCSMFRQNPRMFPSDDRDGDTYVGDAVFRIIYMGILLLILLRTIL